MAVDPSIHDTIVQYILSVQPETACTAVVLAVGVLGGRAAAMQRPDVEALCVDFIQKMHETVGTPPPPEPKAKIIRGN